MKESILGLECLTVQLAISIIPKMNRAVFNSLKPGFTIFLCHMMLTKAFDFNMLLFCQCKHFLTYILSSLLLLQLGRKCYHGNLSAVATSLWFQLSILQKQLNSSNQLAVKFNGNAHDFCVLLPYEIICRNILSYFNCNYRLTWKVNHILNFTKVLSLV